MQRRRPQVRLDVAHVGIWVGLDVICEPLPRTLPGRMLRPDVRARCVQSSMRQSHFPLRRRVGLDDGELRAVVGPGVSVWRAVAQETVGVAAAAGGWSRDVSVVLRDMGAARLGCGACCGCVRFYNGSGVLCRVRSTLRQRFGQNLVCRNTSLYRRVPSVSKPLDSN